MKEIYQHATLNNQIIKQVLEAQNVFPRHVHSPLISFSVFEEYYANQLNRKSSPQTENAPKELLQFFLEERVRLRAIDYLPTLVHFYKLLNTSFANRISQQEALSLSVPRCIQLLAEQEEKHASKEWQTAETVRTAWEEFKLAWKCICKQTKKKD